MRITITIDDLDRAECPDQPYTLNMDYRGDDGITRSIAAMSGAILGSDVRSMVESISDAHWAEILKGEEVVP